MRIVKNGDVHVSAPIGMQAVSSPLQGDDLALGCLQRQVQIHLLLCLSVAVAGMVCRACGSS